MRRSIVLLLSAGALMALGITSVEAASPAPAIENTGLARAGEEAPQGMGTPGGRRAGFFEPFGAGLLAVEVTEAGQGTDLNADGDTDDDVIHVYGTTGTTVNTGLSLAGSFSRFGTGLAFSASSGGIYVLDGGTGVTTMIHPVGIEPVAVGTRLAFRVPEAKAGADLNGDGDMVDSVAHFYDPATGVVTNSKLDAGWTTSGLTAVDVEGRAAITTDMFSVFIYDPVTGTATDTHLDGDIATVFGSHVAVLVSEIPAGSDLNGDGDAADTSVVHVYDTATSMSKNLGLEATFGVFGVSGLLGLSVYEPEQGGRDFNGDGDAFDEVLHLYDPTTGMTTNTRVAAGGEFTSVGGQIVLTVAEEEHGARDLNGDGDVNDVVVELYDPASGVLTNTRLNQAGWSLIVESRIAISVDETAQGDTDLNGDTDAADRVLHIYDPATGLAINTGLAVDEVFPAGEQLGAFVWEGSQGFGGRDLNDDGDKTDWAVYFVNPATGTAARAVPAGALLEVFGTAGSMTKYGDWVAFAASEADSGATDLNGDGDATDDVVHLVNTSRQRAVGLVDPGQGRWHLRDNNGTVTSFYYGDPGDVPFMGDWDCDGTDTPGLYRQSDGFAYLRNTNTAGTADIRFLFGNPRDIPLAGDFNGDGCDTVSLYRPSEQRFYIINKLGTGGGGLGAADLAFTFGNPGDKPFVGDFDGDGIATAGLHRETTGLVYFRNSHTTGIADAQFIFGDPGDRFVTADWGPTDGFMTPAVFRPDDTAFYFRWSNTQGVADDKLVFGQPTWLPVAGTFEPG